MKKILLIALFSICQFTFSQDRGTVKGTLTDKEMNNEALPFANVLIKGTTIGATTDMDGNYSIQVPTGNHVIVFSFVGYQTIEKPIVVKVGKTITINQVMSASEGVALDEVEIQGTTSKEKASALLLEQKKATVIKESIGAQELAQKGVSDAAGAVTKISGVSKQEGSSNVYVRGLGDRYLNTTMNGLTLPSNDVNKKNIDLGLFPSDVIQNVSISKAYSSQFYGDFAAGNVDITSKEYKGKGFVDVEIGSAVNSRASKENFVRSEGTGYFGFYNRYNSNPFAVILSHGVDPVDGGSPINMNIGISAGKSFNFEDESRLSLFGTLSFSNGYEFREGATADYTLDLNKSFPTTREYEYSTQTTAMLNAYYKIDSDNKLKFTSMFLNSSSDQVGYYGVKGLGYLRDARNEDTFETGGSFYQQNVQFNQDLIFVNQIVGDHTFAGKKFDDHLKVTYGVGLNNVFAHEPDRKRISLEEYGFALDNDPSTNPVFRTNNAFDNQRYFQKIKDVELNSRINLAIKTSKKLTLNVGYNGRVKERDFENQRYGYDFINEDQVVNDVVNFNNTFNIENTQFFANQSDGKLYTVNSFRGLSDFNNDNIVSLPGELENTYFGQLLVHAGYVSAEVKLGEQWTIVPGIRVESFNQNINYNVINLGSKGVDTKKSEQTFFLPSVNLKYALNENQNLRLTASKTVSVPEFKEIAPFTYEGVNQRIVGNPDLLEDPAFSNVYNIDIKYEWFLSRGELFSITAFGKQINDPVNKVVLNDVSARQSFFRTGDKATVLGVELEARKDLIKNSDDETQLSAGFNFTYMNTDQDLRTVQGSTFSTSFQRTSDKLQGASDILINANVNYSPTIFENYKPIASLVYSYFSDRIDALGSGELGNVVERGVSTLDFVWKNKIDKHWEINFSAKNLLDPYIKRVREGTAESVQNFTRITGLKVVTEGGMQNIIIPNVSPLTLPNGTVIPDGTGTLLPDGNRLIQQSVGDILLSQYKRGINFSLGIKYNF